MKRRALPGPGVVPLPSPKGHVTLSQGPYCHPLPGFAPSQGTLMLPDSVHPLTPDVPWMQNGHEGSATLLIAGRVGSDPIEPPSLTAAAQALVGCWQLPSIAAAGAACCPHNAPSIVLVHLLA